jgi:hypothetical protein
VLTACNAHVEGGGTKREGGVEVSLTGQEQLMGGMLGKTPATLGWRVVHGNPMKVKFKGSSGGVGDGGGGWADSSRLFHPYALLLALEGTFQVLSVLPPYLITTPHPSFLLLDLLDATISGPSGSSRTPSSSPPPQTSSSF